MNGYVAMVHEMVVSKLLLDLIPITNSAVSEEELTRHFTKTISEYFGIDKVSMSNIYSGDYKGSALLDYVLNTREDIHRQPAQRVLLVPRVHRVQEQRLQELRHHAGHGRRQGRVRDGDALEQREQVHRRPDEQRLVRRLFHGLRSDVQVREQQEREAGKLFRRRVQRP